MEESREGTAESVLSAEGSNEDVENKINSQESEELPAKDIKRRGSDLQSAISKALGVFKKKPGDIEKNESIANDASMSTARKVANKKKELMAKGAIIDEKDAELGRKSQESARKSQESEIVKKSDKVPSLVPNAFVLAGDALAPVEGDQEQNMGGFLNVMYDPDSPFADITVRRHFIIKVFSIVLAQLTATGCIIAFCMLEDTTRKFLVVHWWIPLACAAFEIPLIMFIICTDYRRHYPYNIVLLVVFTTATSMLLGSASAASSTESVILALVICMVCCIAVIFFTMATRRDLTSCIGLIYMTVIVALSSGLMIWFIPKTAVSLAHKVYSGIGAVLFIVYLEVDIQMLMGGTSHEIAPEEFIFASLQIYMDVSNVFFGVLGTLSE